MKFSACTAAFGMADLKKIIDTSAKLGYDAVELTAALHLPVESTPERRKEVLGWIHDAGIVCSALHYIFDGTIRLLSTDSEMMNQSVLNSLSSPLPTFVQSFFVLAEIKLSTSVETQSG